MGLNRKSIFYPPGGILIWIVIYLELITFGLGILALGYYGVEERAVFHQDRLLLNRSFATINTVFLLSSGYLVASAIQNFKRRFLEQSKKQLNWAMLFGLAFLVLKIVEYAGKLQASLDMNYSSFFMFYWLLTGFHWVHVLVGVVILFFLRRTLVTKQEKASLEDLEAGATFWHLCDIIWLLLFPALYLMF